MESNIRRFSVISGSSNSEKENRTSSTSYETSVIKKSLREWVKPLERSHNFPKHIIVIEGEYSNFQFENLLCKVFHFHFHLLQGSLLHINVPFAQHLSNRNQTVVITNIAAMMRGNHMRVRFVLANLVQKITSHTTL